MKKLNGNAPLFQFVLFLIALIYFFGFAQAQIRAESSRCAKEVVYESQKELVEKGEQRTRDIQEIKINLKNLCRAMNVEYID